MTLPSTEAALLESALTRDGVVSFDAFHRFWAERRSANRFEVTRVPFAELDQWYFAEGTGNLMHRTGRFFQIEGINVRTNFGTHRRWSQPIINQPEIGILGFLTQRIDGVLHFLVQAKMEPGNVNLLQVSPTVQATRSNYTQAHGGRRPAYLEYFLDQRSAARVFDQLQSEQASRFLRKRNRNMIVEVPSGVNVEVLPDFCWLTLGQLLELLRTNNLVNMDSRTVLSAIRYPMGPAAPAVPEFRSSVLHSLMSGDESAEHSMGELLSWLTELKCAFELEVDRIPLKDVADWRGDADAIRHVSGRFFEVLGVQVVAGSREVTSWCQPLIESAKGGVIGFVCQRRRGTLHFLIQGRVEPGHLDAVELAPTVQCTPNNYGPDELPPFYEVLMARGHVVHFDTIQSEEGGRFYHDEHRNLIVEIDEGIELALPKHYRWMTLRQMKDFIRFNNYFNIEARGLLSSLG